MTKAIERWWSPRMHHPITLVRWGHHGAPVLLFPTAGGDAEEAERFHLIGALSGLLAAGRIKVYSVDSVAGRAWVEQGHNGRHCTWLQSQFDACIYHEVLPAIRLDCRSDGIEVLTAGASLGAFNAVATLCRHPDAFRAAVCLSGTFDLEVFSHGYRDDDLYFSSPLHFLPNLHGPQLDRLRSRFVLLSFGLGRWEDPDQSWRLAGVLGGKGIANRVEPWGLEHDHDWPTWRAMLPHFLAQLC